MRRLVQAVLLVILITGCGRTEPEPTPNPTPEPAPEQNTPDPVALAALVTYPSFKDADPHSWTGRTPYSYPIHGIDVSRWQGEIDWSQIKAAGVSFAYIKATEGGDLVDPMFKRAIGRGPSGQGGAYWSL